MANPVKLEDLFLLSPDDAKNLQEFTAAVQALSRNYRNFAKNLEGDSARVKSVLDAVTGQASTLRQQATDINLLNEKERATMAALTAEAAKLVQERQRLEKIQAAQAAAQRVVNDATTQAVSALRAMQNELREAYAAKDTARIEKAALALRNARTETASLSAALRGANTEFTAAKGSYDALDAQNKRLVASLKALQGGLDGGGEEARQLEKQIEANTEALKAFDARILVFNRNVGNYRDGFAGLVQELAKARAAQATFTAGTEEYNRQQIKVAGFQREAQRSAAQMGLSYEQAEAKINGVTGALQPLATSLLRLENEQQRVAQSAGKDSEAYNRLGFEIQATKKKLDDAAVATSHIELETSNFTDQLGLSRQALEQYAIQLAAGTIGIEALIEGGKAFFNLNKEYSAELAELRKTTGLTADEADRLGNSLTTLVTPTTLKGLLSIATVGGQLNVAKEDLLEFTKAVDIGVQALGNDFTGGAEEIATKLGKISNVFRKELGANVAQNILAIGSAINQLGAEGAATAPFLADVAIRTGQTSAQFGLGLKNALAYAAVLEENGSTAEIAGTSLNRLYSTLGNKTKEAYEIAKKANPALTLQDFTRLVNTDFNQAIQVFLKGLNAGNASTTEVNKRLATLKLESGEAKSAILALAANTELFAERQRTANDQLRDATSLAAEAAVNNDTLAGSVDKTVNATKNFFVSGTAGNVLKFLVDATRGLYSNTIGSLFTSIGDGIAYVKEKTGLAEKPLVDYTAKTVQSALATLKQVAAQEQLLNSYTALRDNTQRTAAQEVEYSTLRAKLVQEYGTAETKVILDSIARRKEQVENTKTTLRQEIAAFTTGVDEAQRKFASAQDAITTQLAGKTAEQIAAIRAVAQARANNPELAASTSGRSLYSAADIAAATRLNTAEELLKSQQLLRGQAVAALAKLEGQKTQAVQDGIPATEEATKAEEQLDRAAQQRAKNRVGALRDELADNQERLRQLRDYQAKQSKLFENNQITSTVFADSVRGSEDLAEQIQRDGAAIRIKIVRAEAAERLQEAENDRIRQSNKKNISEAELTDIQQQYALRAVDIERQKNRDIANVQKELSKATAVEPLDFSNASRSLQAYNDQLKEFVKTYEYELAAINNADTARTSELTGQLANREITQAQFDKRASKSRLQAASEALALDKKYHRSTLETQKEYNEALLANQRLTVQQRLALIDQVGSYAQQAENALFAIRSNFLDAQLQRENEAYDQQINAAGNNAALKKQIEEKHQKELKRLAYEKAKNDQRAALFSIAIDTAVAVAKSIAQYGLPYGLIPAAAALVIGGLQAAVVLSKPLPAYFKGRTNGPAEAAQLGERGPELAGQEKTGYRLYTKPTVGYLAAGDRVYTAPQTRDILAQNELVEGRLVQRQYQNDLSEQTTKLRVLRSGVPYAQVVAEARAAQVRDTDRIVRAIERQEQLRVTEEGLERWARRGDSWTQMVNRRYKGER